MSTAAAIRSELLDALPSLVARIPFSAKQVANDVGVTPRAIEGTRQREHLPSLHVGLALARKYPEIRELFHRLMDAEQGGGENPEQLAAAIAQFLMTRGPK